MRRDAQFRDLVVGVRQALGRKVRAFDARNGKLLRLIVENQDQPRVIKVAGKPLRADPRRWSDDMTVSVFLWAKS